VSVQERLLRREIALAFADDPGLRAVYGWAPHGRALVVAPGVSPVEDAGDAFEPEVVPWTVVTLGRALGTDRIEGGPTWYFQWGGPRVPEPVLPIVTSGSAGEPVRPDHWGPDEWARLVAGESGPWAMAVDGDEPVCIAHTPVALATEAAAEAGVWTRPDHRGRGLAAPTLRAWWELESRRSAVVFYRTSADDRRSREVAKKLDLVPLGWLWTIR
jgi:RimJ/RimL family protein N-acetyltransferase